MCANSAQILAKSAILQEVPDSAREGRFCTKSCMRRIAEFQEPCVKSYQEWTTSEASPGQTPRSWSTTLTTPMLMARFDDQLHQVLKATQR